MKLGPILVHFNKITAIVLCVIAVLLVYPFPIQIGNATLLNDFVKTRILSLGLVFLILRGMIHDYYSARLGVLFLIMIILSPTLSFAQLILATLFGLLILRLFKMI